MSSKASLSQFARLSAVMRLCWTYCGCDRRSCCVPIQQAKRRKQAAAREKSASLGPQLDKFITHAGAKPCLTYLCKAPMAHR